MAVINPTSGLLPYQKAIEIVKILNNCDDDDFTYLVTVVDKKSGLSKISVYDEDDNLIIDNWLPL